MNKYPRVGSVMFLLNEKGEATSRVKVLKEDKNHGGIKVVSFSWLKHEKSFRDVQDEEIENHSQFVSLNVLSN